MSVTWQKYVILCNWLCKKNYSQCQRRCYMKKEKENNTLWQCKNTTYGFQFLYMCFYDANRLQLTAHTISVLKDSSLSKPDKWEKCLSRSNIPYTWFLQKHKNNMNWYTSDQSEIWHGDRFLGSKCQFNSVAILFFQEAYLNLCKVRTFKYVNKQDKPVHVSNCYSYKIQRYELFIKLIKSCKITAAINQNSRVKSTLSSCKYENKIIVLQRNLFQQKTKHCALMQQETLSIL